MLTISNLSVNIGDKTILSDIHLTIKKGEILVLFGPNGSGKSTLIKTIMGFDEYSLREGQVVFKGKDLAGLSIEERVRLGMGIMYQHPPKIRGVHLSHVAQFLCRDQKRVTDLARRLSLIDHLGRDVNYGFSGGETKRSELFQIVLQSPDLVFLDEPESGVDLENISTMGKVLDEYLARHGKSALIITHTGYILDYIHATRGCVMIDGKLWCMGDPKEIFENIQRSGYEKCKECQCPKVN